MKAIPEPGLNADTVSRYRADRGEEEPLMIFLQKIRANLRAINEKVPHSFELPPT